MKTIVSLILFTLSLAAQAEKGTVCTITVNSPDEKQTFRQYLSKEKWDFVELVESGRADWLETACRRRVKCDLLIISGHFSPGTGFYPEEGKSHENLKVEEMERVSCSESCPNLFGHLKEVYMFGCNTLNVSRNAEAPGEVVRALRRAGYNPQQAERIAREMAETHGESSSDQMRRIFVNTPVIYGFGAAAPLGPYAAVTLNRYFRTALHGEIGTGQVSKGLLSAFSANSMRSVPGLSPNEKGAAHRSEVCNFYDRRLSAAEKIKFIGRVLERNPGELRLFFPRIEKFLAELTEAEKGDPEFSAALGAISADTQRRDGYLRVAQDADQAPMRARMLKVARELNWLTDETLREQVYRMVNDLVKRGQAEPQAMDLVCRLNREIGLQPDRHFLEMYASERNPIGPRAMAACLGSAQGYGEMLAILSQSDQKALEYAQVYFRYFEMRPTDIVALIDRISSAASVSTQVTTLGILAKLYVSEAEVLSRLLEYFTNTASPEVQRAIAGVFVRARFDHIDKRAFASTLSQRRLRSTGDRDVIDFVIRRLELR